MDPGSTTVMLSQVRIATRSRSVGDATYGRTSVAVAFELCAPGCLPFCLTAGLVCLRASLSFPSSLGKGRTFSPPINFALGFYVLCLYVCSEETEQYDLPAPLHIYLWKGKYLVDVAGGSTVYDCKECFINKSRI